MAHLEATSYVPEVGHHDSVFDEWRAQDKAIQDAQQFGLYHFAKTGSVRFAIYKTPVADGYAIYRVTKLRPFTVQHIKVGDAWHAPAPLIRGLTKNDVAATLEFDLATSQMLGTR